MNESIISVRYTKALFLLSKEKGLLDIVKNDMEMVFNVMNQSNELQHIFQNPVLKPTKKKEIINQIFNSFNELTLSFINLLIKNRRESHLFDISRNFLDRFRQDKGIETAVFSTATDMDSKMIDKVKKLIMEAMKTEIEINNKIDQNLIGGFVIRVGDKQYDSSVKSNLNKIKKKLLNTSIDLN
jgi:F-type H+-transporting ATPase subunit delta